MSQLRTIYRLLCEEYAVSRHIWWVDEETSKFVNDVTYSLHQIIFCVRRLRDGDYDAWQDLVQYCFSRSMSVDLIDAIGEYIRKDVDLVPLPLITLKTQSVSVRCEAEYLMFDHAERDPVHIRGQVDQPEPNRQMAFKRDHTWTHYKWRLRDDRPKVTSQKTSHSIHWMFV